MKRILFLLVCIYLSVNAFGQSGTTGPLTWSLNNGTLTISGNGAMPSQGGGGLPDYEWPESLWYNYNITAVNIENGVISIGNYAFHGCSELTSITIPNSVTSIGVGVFEKCMKLSTINVDGANYNYSSMDGILFNKNKTSLLRFPEGKSGSTYSIPNSVTSIGEHAFRNCSGLTSVTIPNSVTSIGYFAFSYCSGLTSVTIPNSVTSIESYTFSDCSSLTSIIIPSSVTIIKNDAFRNCSGLTSATIPNSVTSIERDAFMGCSGLTSVTIPNSVTSIGNYAFFHCSSLTSIIIPSSVTSIGNLAFGDCSSLTDVSVEWAIPFEAWGIIFYDTPLASATLHVPTGTKALYEATEEWEDFGTIVEDDEVTACDLTTVPTNSAYYEATADLCGRTVLSGSDVDGSVDVNGKLRREHLAKIAFRGLYLLNGGTIPAVGALSSDNYPSIYTDLNTKTAQNNYYYRPAKALVYLEYGDGVPVFDRNRSTFNPTDNVARVDVLKALLETFDIKPDLTASGSYTGDAATLKANNPLKFGYIYKAKSLGIIDDINTFRPFDDCVRGEAFLMLYRIMTKIEANAIPAPNLTTASYFEPLNVTTANIATGLGTEAGNFTHYTKAAFAISGVTPLLFSHTYHSFTTELPDEFFGMFNSGQGKTFTYKPLGAGWSHPYHSFVTVVNNRMIVHWGGSTIHVYSSNGTAFVCESAGVYDEASIAGGILTIKTKSQVEYRFKANGSISSGVLELYSIKDRNGNELSIRYENGVDGVARITSVSDGSRSLTFSYKSGTNLISQVSDPLGRNVRFDYTLNTALNEYLLTSYIDAKNQTTRYEYSAGTGQARLLTKIQLPKGNYITNQYDANRRLSQSESGVNGTPVSKTAVTVASAYRANSRTMSSTVKTYHEGATSYDYNYTFNGNNNVTKLTGNQELEVTAAYGNTAHATLPTSLKTNSSEIEQIQYDSKGNVTQVTQKSNTGGETHTVKMTYNSFNDVTSVTDALNHATYYDYDGSGNLTKVRAPENGTIEYTVNSKGLITNITNPEGISTGLNYNAYGNLTTTTVTALNLTSTVGYDKASRVTSIKDFLNRETRFAYDANDNLLSEVNALNHTTGYGYDANDNLTAITNAKGGVTSMSYDNTDRLTAVSFGGATKRYAYNDDGSLKTFTKPDGTTLSNTYDNLGRITHNGVSSYTYDALHRLATVTKDNRALTFGYDGFNRIKDVNYEGTTVSYAHDANGNITAITYPGNKTVTYTYDNLNRMKSVKDWDNRTITYNYRKDSRLQSVTYPNGMTVNYTYDRAGRQTGKTAQRTDNSVITSYAFTLDNAGNITQENRTEPYADAFIPSETVNYTYNNANRIQQAGDISFTFDANGNTTSRGGANYTYNQLDKLTSDSKFTFEYDGLGNIRSNGSKRYVIDISGMGNVLAETDLSNNPTAYYLYGLGLEARILPNGTAEYYVSDYRGSVVAMVNESANITHKYQYDEFGKVIQKDESDANPFQYVGQYGVMYVNDNLSYMRARFYDPTIGRFLSEDPIWSTNLYPYADNNPVMGIDPMGLYTLEELYYANQNYWRAKVYYEEEKAQYSAWNRFWGSTSDEYKQAKDNLDALEKELNKIKKDVYYDLSKGGFIGNYQTGILKTDPKKISKKNLNVLLSNENINKSYSEWQSLQFTYAEKLL
jgi:RHS repeat-associated protein